MFMPYSLLNDLGRNGEGTISVLKQENQSHKVPEEPTALKGKGRHQERSEQPEWFLREQLNPTGGDTLSHWVIRAEALHNTTVLILSMASAASRSPPLHIHHCEILQLSVTHALPIQPISVQIVDYN